MLFTRCPSCVTTFRITAEALREAGGQVRCGNCATIFNAYRAELGDAETDANAPPAGDSIAERPGDRAADEHASAAAEAVQTGLKSDDNAATPELTWSLEPVKRQRNPWRYAATASVLVLFGQGVHHYRAELAAQSLVGPPLTRVYTLFGATLTPRWDVGQYEVIDSSARTGPTAAARGSLVIAARIYNGGPRAQPYPHVYLKLKDRWDSVVGSRMFRPSEYLEANVEADSLMAVDDTAQARLTVVDPGPDTYGFELDVCIEREPEQLSCKTDSIFR